MLDISVRFAADFPEDARVSLRGEGDQLPEYGQVWIWNMVYAQTLHAIADTAAGQRLREDLELWAVNMSSKVFQPMAHIKAKGHLMLRPELLLVDSLSVPDTLTFRIAAAAKEMPKVVIVAPDELPAETRAAAVVALGQYFINQNELFTKELPLHILAFRKFYGDILPERDPNSVDDAPLFAIQKALEYFNSVATGTRH